MNDYMRLGQQAVQHKKLAESVEWFRKAVKESPKDAQANACLGQSLCWLGYKSEGFEYLGISGQILLKKAKKTRDIKLVLDLADQMQHWEDYQGSLTLCKQALKLNGAVGRGYQLLALSHMRLNQKKPALSAGKKALSLVPDNSVLTLLVGTLEINDGQFERARKRLEKLLENPLLKPEEKFRVHKELARLLDKMKVFDQVFGHLHAAGKISERIPQIQRQDATYVPNMLTEYKTGFSLDVVGKLQDENFADAHPAPVFVVGFMRTGTTLTQEVLGAHPQVFVADESDLLIKTINEMRRRLGISDGSAKVVNKLDQLDIDNIKQLREFYWQQAKALYGDACDEKLFLDKTTMNSIDLGFINVIFPDAKLIFLIRDPRDVCLSCIMQTMTPTPSTVHLNKWESTARFYAQVMDWWLTVKPRLSMANMELRYEDAVFEFETTFTRVFDFLGLPWDPAVTEFHKKALGKVISSPSYSQVAQPLYSSSVGRWQNYASEYEAIESVLHPFLDEFDYS